MGSIYVDEMGISFKYIYRNKYIEYISSFKFDIYLIMTSFSKYLLNMYVPGTVPDSANSKKWKKRGYSINQGMLILWTL